MVAVALCLTLLLIVVVLVYRRKKEGLDADVADSSILTTGFQPMGIKPSKPGVWAPRPRRPPPHSSRTLFFGLNSSVHLLMCLFDHCDGAALIHTLRRSCVCICGDGFSVLTVGFFIYFFFVMCRCVSFICQSDPLCFTSTSLSGNVAPLFIARVALQRFSRSNRNTNV